MNKAVVVIVRQEECSCVSQLKLLPYRTHLVVPGKLIEVIRHSKAEEWIDANRLDRNWDFKISVDHDSAEWHATPGRLPRGSKLRQAVEIGNIGKDIEGFIAPLTYQGYDDGYDPKVAWIVKPLYGARGIGQIFIPRGIPVRSVLEQMTLLDKIEPLLEKYPTLGYNTHGEKQENEGWQHLKNKTYCVQEFIDDVSFELRIIISVTKEYVYCGIVKRNRLGAAYLQACGNFDTLGEILPINVGRNVKEALENAVLDVPELKPYTDQLDNFLDGLALFIERLGITYGSIDVFTKDGLRQWGVFEYSPEFAYSSFDSKGVRDMTVAWYLDQVRMYLDQLGMLPNHAPEAKFQTKMQNILKAGVPVCLTVGRVPLVDNTVIIIPEEDIEAEMDLAAGTISIPNLAKIPRYDYWECLAGVLYVAINGTNSDRKISTTEMERFDQFVDCSQLKVLPGAD